LLLCSLMLVPPLLLAGIVLLFTAATYPPMPEALESLEQTGTVDVRSVVVQSWPDYHYYAFAPKEKIPKKGLILYPGAFIDPRSYAPAARAIAQQGYTVVVVEMPLAFALFGWKRAQHIMEAFPLIDTWAVGGHSLGGSSACKFYNTYPSNIAGVVLLASRFPREYRCDDRDLKVLALYGTRDGMLTVKMFKEARNQFPSGTTFVEIRGGNHTQFGWYADGQQRFDEPAEITLTEQQDIIIHTTVDFLDKL